MMYGTGPLGRKPAGQFNFEPPPPGTALYLEPTPEADPRDHRRRDGRRQPPRDAAPGVGPSAGLLLPARGRALRPARADRQAHPLPEEGRRLLLHDPRRRPRGRERRVVLPGAARRRAADRGPDRVLLGQGGPLDRGGRGGRRPPSRSRTTGSTSRKTSRHIRISLDGRAAGRDDPRVSRCSSRTCRPAGTCRARTSSPSSSPATRTRSARTRATPAITRSASRTAS